MGITQIGIVGSGFIATGLRHLIEASPDFTVAKILTRRPLNSINDFPQGVLTNSLNELIDHSDIVVECSGDVIHATETVLAATNAKKKVVTMNSEFHVTTGSYFVRRGDYVTDADGDQPGCIARLRQEIIGMGFEPLAYINIKGFLNLNPERKDMEYWSKLQNLSLDQTVSFTDGTKLQVEQAFVANGLGATIPANGMLGATIENLHDTDYLVEIAMELGRPVSDFVLCKGAPPGVLIIAKSKLADSLGDYTPIKPLRTKKGLGYVLLRPYHLTHLEILNTIRKVLKGDEMLLNNSAHPELTVVALAKHKMSCGDVIERGAGGFDVRGVAVKIDNNKDAVPICLLQNTKLIRDIEPGQIVRFDDVEMADTQALHFYKNIIA